MLLHIMPRTLQILEECRFSDEQKSDLQGEYEVRLFHLHHSALAIAGHSLLTSRVESFASFEYPEI